MTIVVDGVERRVHWDGKLHKGYWADCGLVIQENWFVAIGTVFEWYEFFLFGYLAKPINVNFFQGNSTMTWLAAGMSFGFRPLGAAVLGWFGDTYGRRKAFLLSIYGMNFVTFAHGVLPTYYLHGKTWGTVGMVLLLIMRASQGFFTGGQVGASAVALAEIKDKRMLGCATGLVATGLTLGILAANGAAALVSSVLSKDQLNNWGWRIPFLCAAVPGLIAVLKRKSMDETVNFNEEIAGIPDEEAVHYNTHNKAHHGETHEKHHHKYDPNLESEIERPHHHDHSVAETPLAPAEKKGMITLVKELVSEYPVNCLFGMFATASSGTWAYMAAGSWGVWFISEYGNISSSTALFAAMMGNLCGLTCVMYMSPLMDRYGCGLVASISSNIACLTGCTIWIVQTIWRDNFTVCFVCIMALCYHRPLLGGTQIYLWTSENYPTRVRMSGFIFYNLTLTIFGGGGPVFCEFLASQNVFFPSIFIICFTLMTSLGFLGAYIKHQNGTYSGSYIRPEKF